MSFLKELFRSLTQKERLLLALAALGILTGAAGIGAFVFQKYTRTIPAPGGVYREGVVGQPAYVNPVLARSAADTALVALLFRNAAELAEKTESMEGGRAFRLHLKDGLTWSDGREITADDVVFTVEQVKNPESDSPLAAAWQGITAERVSQLEVLFRLPTPYALFAHTLEALPVLPKHLHNEVPVQNWRLSDYILRPVGSGPYVAASYERGADGFIDTYRLRANRAMPGEQPFIEEITLRFFRTNEALLKEFNAGRIDGFFSGDPGLMEKIERPFTATRLAMPTSYAVFWNQDSGTLVRSARVREALRLAVDREALAAELLGAYGAPATDPLSPFFFPALSSTSSPDRARELLSLDGWSANDEGVLSKKRGATETRLEFTLIVPDTPLLKQAAELLVRRWADIGIRVKTDILPLEKITGEIIKNRTYEALLFGNTLELSGDLYPFWHSTERFSPGLNLSLYRNAKADAFMEAIRGEGDAEKRKNSMDELRRLIVADDPALFLFSPSGVSVTAKRIQGIPEGVIAGAAARFGRIEAWYAETRRIWR